MNFEQSNVEKFNHSISQNEKEKNKEKESGWKKEFIEFNGSEACDLLFSQIKKESLIKNAIKGKKPLSLQEEQHHYIKEGFGCYDIDYQGKPVKIRNAAKYTRTPEFVARKLKTDIKKIKKQWGNKKEIVWHGAVIETDVAKIDENLDLIISDDTSYFPDINFGRFLKVENDNCRNYPDIKFDINIQKLNDKGYVAGEELYDFIEMLVEMSRENNNATIEVKDLIRLKDKKLCLAGSMHLYPRFENDLDDEQVSGKLNKVYENGKKFWGLNFNVNDSSDGLRNKRFTFNGDNFKNEKV